MLVKVNEEKLGDCLVGVVVEFVEECVVVKVVFFKMMFGDLCNNLVVLYEIDEVMCII